MATADLSKLDDVQAALMEEVCILVTPEDVAYGQGSKKECHLMANIRKGLLHRAFSVFVFRPSDCRLLLQCRSADKITFPAMWTNTCCSHPLHMESELIEEGQMGVRNAAIRKLPHELGIKPDAFKPEDFTFLTRIHYQAGSGETDAIWGEHEIDYILMATKDVELDINPNEVSEVKYVSLEELEAMLADDRYTFTPWFMTLVKSNLLQTWWKTLIERSKPLGQATAQVLESEQESGIRRMS